MIDHFWQQAEQDASRNLLQAASARERRVLKWKTRHALHLITGILSFTALLVGQAVSIAANFLLTPWLAGLAIATLLTVIYAAAGHTAQGLEYAHSLWVRSRTTLVRIIGADYLSPHFYFSLIFIVAPIVFLFVWILLPHLENHENAFVVAAHMSSDNALRGLLTSLMAVELAIIAAQVALFNFVFSQLLGKYASGVVQVVIKHRAVGAARIGAFLLLALVMFALNFGVPSTYVAPVPYFQLFVITLSLLCFAVSISIANTGVHAVHAIDLAGIQFAKRTRTAVPKPIDTNSSQIVWTVLGGVGLDWRDSRRFATIGEPKRGIDVARGALQMLFGIAAKAIQDGQHDVLLVSCRAITRVAASYAQRRAAYIAAEDGVFAYMNDQSAALVKTASKSVNEYLVTDIVRLVGALGLLSVSIGKLPSSKDDTHNINQSLQSHVLSAMWINLLKEAVVATFELQRTHATGVAIDQMQIIALWLHGAGYASPLTNSFLSDIEQVHALCIAKPNAYGVSLAAKCIRAVMSTWAQVLRGPSKIRGAGSFTDAASKCLLRMAGRSFAAEKGTVRMDFSDFTCVVASRTTESAILLHDLVLTAVYRKTDRNADRHAAVEDAIQIIQLISDSAVAALRSDIHNADSYLDSLYRIAAAIVADWPASLNEVPDEINNHARTRRGGSPRERLEQALFVELEKLLDAFIKADVNGLRRWSYAFFSVIGLEMFASKAVGSEHLKSCLQNLADKFEGYLARVQATDQQSVIDEDFAYLQLLGAWLFYYKVDTDAAQRIAEFIGAHRSVEDSLYGGTQGRLGWLGYPMIYHSDFGLKRMDSTSLSDEAIAYISGAARELISDDVLVGYGQLIRALQEPRREGYYSRIRNSSARRGRINQPPTPPNGEDGGDKENSSDVER